MKRYGIISIVVCAFVLTLCGCKDARTTKKVIDTVRKEYKALNSNNAYKYHKYKHRYETAKKYINNSNQTHLCGTCNGYGVLYLIDAYGNAITDGYGNFQFTSCSNCGGNGYVSY